jgi:hypothetical protein
MAGTWKFFGGALFAIVFGFAISACSSSDSGAGTLTVDGCPSTMQVSDLAHPSAVYHGTKDTLDQEWTWSSDDGGAVVLIDSTTGNQGDRIELESDGAGHVGGTVAMRALTPGTVEVEARQKIDTNVDQEFAVSATCSIVVSS